METLTSSRWGISTTVTPGLITYPKCSGVDMRVVVIGNGTAGQTASAVAKKDAPDAEVIVLEKHRYPSYHPCALPYVVAGKLPLEDALERTTRPGIEVVVGAKATKIDTESKVVHYVKDGSDEKLDYDVLIIATGLTPTKPPIRGLELEGVRVLWDVEDAEYIMKHMGERVVVVGGSATGIEVAGALSEVGKEVWLVEMMEQLMPGKIDPPVAAAAAKYLASLGVKVLLKSPVKEIRGPTGRVSEVVAGDEVIEADTVIVAAGVKPNSQLAAESGLPIGEAGGVKVDERLQAAPDVYAAGDVAEVRDFVTGRPTVTGLVSTALVQGRIAGRNAVGGDLRYKGALSPFVVHVRDYLLAGVGLSSTQAERLSIPHITGRFSSQDLEKYVPGSSKMVTWLVASPEGRVLGAQFLGQKEVWGRVTAATLAILHGMTLKDLLVTEFAYHPLVTPVSEPLTVLAASMMRRYMLRD